MNRVNEKEREEEGKNRRMIRYDFLSVCVYVFIYKVISGKI